MKKKISIIIPTYNSKRTLEKTLVSIRTQNIDQSLVDILIIDGGSTDGTIKLATKYNCMILKNEMVQQEYAKYIGLLKCNSRYILFLDSDEQFSNSNSIDTRVKIFNANNSIHALFSSGYKSTSNSLINEYVSTFGDPFAYFMYNTSPNYRFYVDDCKKQYKYNETNKLVLFSIKKGDTIPLVDLCAGAMLDMDYVKKFVNLKSNILYVPQLPSLIIKSDKLFAVVKDEYIIHDSAENYSHFINKLKWRTVVNIHYKDIPGTGHANREDLQPRLFNIKKYLYIPFALSFIGPIMVSFYVFITRSRKSAILHTSLTIFVALSIVKNLLMNLFGLKPVLHIYGKTGNYNNK